MNKSESKYFNTAIRMDQAFLEHMRIAADAFASNIQECPLEELYLVTPAYLTPYLTYIAQNQRLFRTMLNNFASLGSDKAYRRMMRRIFTPILNRFQLPESNRQYIVAFYIHGLLAIISE